MCCLLLKDMVKDITEGRNGIRAGCIGEIGCMYPLEHGEEKSLVAASKAQVPIVVLCLLLNLALIAS